MRTALNEEDDSMNAVSSAAGSAASGPSPATPDVAEITRAAARKHTPAALRHAETAATTAGPTAALYTRRGTLLSQPPAQNTLGSA